MPRFQDLAEGQLLKFSDISGLEGYNNLFKKEGNNAVPYLGADTGATQLNEGVHNTAANIVPLTYAVGGNLKQVTAQGSGGGIKLWQDTSGRLFNDPSGSSPYHQTAEQLTSQGYQIQGGKSYAEDLNNITTPRAIDGTVMSGADAMARQARERQAYINAPTGQELKTSEVKLASLPNTYGSTKNPLDPFNTGRVYSPNADVNKGHYVYDNKGGITWIEGATGDTRSLISKTPQTGYVKGYDTHNDYASVYVPAGKYVQGISLYPKPSNDITAEKLSNKESNIVLPNVPTADLTSANALVAGANANLAEIMRSITPPTSETEKKQQSLLDAMASLTGQEANKAADQLTAEQSAGLPQLKQQFADINARILTKMAEYNALNADVEGKPITMASIIGSQAQISRVKASEIGLLQAQAQGLQGQISTAQETVNRAIDLKYSTIESQLQVYQAQLNALKPELNREGKIQAQAQQIMIDNQIQALADKKAEEKRNYDLILGYINDYKDAGINITDTLAQAQAKLKSSKIYQKDVKVAGTGSGGTVGGKVSSMTQAVIDNPSLFDDLTPTNRGKVISELQTNGYDTSNLGVKGLSDTAIKEISQTQKALEDLNVLKTTISSNLEFIGPISGWQKLNPWSKARQVQADIDRVKQTVGKALEGGVLRKEDEEKYKKILATITDTPETALYKLDSLTTSLNKDIETYKSLQQSSGRSLNVGASLTKKATTISTGSTSGGNTYTVTKE